MQSGGAVIDTQGYNDTIAQALLTNSGSDGGLTKLGSGLLTLTASNTYTGTTNVADGSLQLGDGASSTGAVAGGISLANGSTLVFANPTSLSFANAISGSGSLVASGPGGLVLSGTNTYSGTTAVNGGYLAFSTSASIPSGGTVTINNGAALVLTSIYTPANWLSSGLIAPASSGAVALTANSPQNLNFQSPTTYATLSLGSSGSNTYSGTLTPVGTTYRLGGGGGTLTMTQPLNGGYDLLVSGPGGVVLSNATSLNLNSLQMNSAAGTASLQLVGPTYSIGSLSNTGTAAAKLNLGNAAGAATTLTVGGDNSSSTFGGIIGDLVSVNAAAKGGLIKTGSGTLLLTNYSSYSGPTIISGGTVKLSAFTAGLYEGMVSTSNSTFDTADSIPHTSVQLSARWGDSKTSGGNNIYPAWGDDTTWGYTGYLYNPSSQNVSYEFGKNFDDDGYLKIDGTVLINDTTWTAHPTATMTLAPGWHSIDLRFGQGGGGVGPIDSTFGGHGMAFSTNGGSTWSSFTDPGSGSLLAAQLGGVNVLPAATALSISAGSTLDLGGGSQQLVSLADASPGAGGSIINGLRSSPSVLTLSATGGSTTFSGQILGGGTLGVISLTMSGGGTQVLGGSNSFTGGSTVSGGLLRLANPSALGPASNSLTTSGGTLDLNNFGLSVGSLAGYFGTVLSNSGTASVLTVNQASGGSTYGGILAKGSGTLGLTKTGGGTLVLSGSNTYTGPTLISNGTLRLNGAVSGFGGNGSGWTLGDSTGGHPVTVAGNVATLTTANGSEANAMWYARNCRSSSARGRPISLIPMFRATAPTAAQFVIQSNGPNALGNAGGSKGLSGTNGAYAPLTHSAEIVWNIYGNSQVNYLTGGSATTSTATGNGVNLDNTAPVNFTLAYDGTSTLNLTAVQSGNTWTQSYPIALGSALNNPANGVAYLGFVGGTGGLNALQQVSNFTFSSYGSLGNVLPSTSPVQIAAGAVLDINGGSQTIGSLSGAGTLTNSNSILAGTLLVGGDNTSQTFSGQITSAVPANLALIKIGSGTQTLGGSDTYIGPTTVQAGTLRLRAGGAVRGAVFVNGGTLDTGGFTQTIQSLAMAGNAALSLSLGNLLTSTGTAGLAGTLNVLNFTAGTAELLAYSSESGTFSNVYGLPPVGYKLAYTPTQLDIVQTITSTTFNLSASAAASALHVGDATTVTATITNAGTGLADALNYSGLNLNASAGSLGGPGLPRSGGPLTLGASDSGSLTYVAVAPGMTTITPTATGTNATTGGTVAQGLVSGAMISVYRLASAGTLPAQIDLGVVHINGTFPTQAISVQNTALSDGYSECLDVSVGSLSGGASSNGGAIQLLPPGTSDGSSIVVGLSSTTTTAPGNVSGTVGLVLASDGAGTSKLGVTPIAGQTVTLTGTVFCGNGAWCGTSGSLWSASGNWTDAEGVQAAPGTFAAFAACDTATFCGAGSATTISLSEANPSLAALVFSGSDYTLTDGTLTLAADAGMPAIIVSASTTQTIFSTIAGTQGLLKEGPGRLVLSGTNKYLGGTTVADGPLIVTDSAAIVDGTDVTVGDASYFAASVVPSAMPSQSSAAAGLPVAAAGEFQSDPSSSAVNDIAVPEPGTLGLLGIGALGLLGLAWRRKQTALTARRAC